MFLQSVISKYKLAITTLLFFALFASSYFLYLYSKRTPNLSDYSKSFIRSIEKKESSAKSYLNRIGNDIKNSNSDLSCVSLSEYSTTYDNEGLAFFVYDHDSLISWSTNAVAFDTSLIDSIHKKSLIHLKNGWFDILHDSIGSTKAVCLILVKQDYRYQNEYLANSFPDGFSLPDNIMISSQKGYHDILLHGNFLCSLSIKEAKAEENSLPVLILFLFVCGLLTFIYLVTSLFGKLSGAIRPTIIMIITIFSLVLIRILFFHYSLPGYIYSLDLFGPKYYAASEVLPSLGDLLLNIIFLFCLALFIFRKTVIIPALPKMSSAIKWIIAFCSFAMAIVLFYYTETVFKGLIINSDLPLNLNNIFSLNIHSITGFLIISLLLFSFFLLSVRLCQIAHVLLSNRIKYIVVVAVSIVVYGLILPQYNSSVFFYSLMLLIYFIGVEYYLSKNGSLFSVSSSVFFIIVFSLIATFGLHRYNDFKEKEKRKLTAIKLAAERDPVAEYLFVETERHIKRDDSIQKYLRLLPDEENKIVKRLQHHIFTGYWSKYDLQVTLCRATDSLLIKPDNFKTGCDDFFNRMISNIGQPTALTEDLYYLNNGSGRNSYLATIRFSPDSTDNTPATTMYIELDAKFIPKELGYPELLIDKDSRVNKDVSNYSYAKYKNDSMITQYGKYFYSLNAKSYKNINDEFTFFTLDGYNHLYYKVDKSNSLIISKKQEDLLDMIAPFSYLFAFFLLVVLVVFLIVFSPINIKDLYLSFKGRLQVAMISIVLFSFIFIGATTVYYIMTVYRNKNIDNISEKAHSVLVEMENKLSDYDQLTPEMKEYLTELLTKFSNVFFTDINLYDLSGDLISSSRNKIFHEGLVSRKMNPTAFNELSVNEKTLYIHDENIGNLNYISVYIPFRNNQNKVIGYINVPYFAKQSELKKEISTFLVAFLNIYVLLIALAIIFALLISNYIARPLKFIRDKLSQIKLGKPNEKIDWNKKDELGALINEYNRMIDELSKSAKLLAESERESAWSEMAKQVAHEIKNPLTPMKLSVQHLQKAWNEKAPDWEERLERFTQTMTEQIESLSSIASEFSDFAKISKTKTEKINLVKIIETSMSLYEDYHHIIISFTKSAPHLFVNADKTQLLRVFNNLLKNSVQAIGNKEEGKIDISVIMEQKNYLIIITDNGSGISTEKTDKIFTPNFTTKTGGMGLGLAMVKSIIESTGGKIWFESEENIGTSFYITLPLYDDNEIN